MQSTGGVGCRGPKTCASQGTRSPDAQVCVPKAEGSDKRRAGDWRLARGVAFVLKVKFKFFPFGAMMAPKRGAWPEQALSLLNVICHLLAKYPQQKESCSRFCLLLCKYYFVPKAGVPADQTGNGK